MQVERESGFGHEYSGGRVRNTWIICLQVWDNPGKLELIPDKTTGSMEPVVKGGLRAVP